MLGLWWRVGNDMALNLWDAQGQHLLAPDLTGWLAAEGERSGTFLPSKHIKMEVKKWS
jgi:hypothetical protein